MRDRFRVLQVLEATAGGTRRFICELLSHLPRSEFDPIVACSLSRDPAFADDVIEFRRRGIDVRIVPMFRSIHPIRDGIAIGALRRIVAECRCDFIHLHSGKAGLLGRIAAVGFASPVIYSPHAFSFLQDGAIGRVASWIERILAPQTQVLLAVSEAERRLALETGFFPPGIVRVLPNAIDVGSHEQMVGPLTPIRAPEGVRRFALIGELRPQKRPLLFLEAARRLLKRGKAAHFLLPARGQLLPEALDFVRRHSLNAHVSFVAASQSLSSAYRQMDLGVLPSKYEGLPYALLEALALRRPVIGSNIGVFRDIIGSVDERLLFQSEDPEALADALELWATLPTTELVSAGQKGRALVRTEYSMEDWKIGIVKLYHEVARMKLGRITSDPAPPPVSLPAASWDRQPYDLAPVDFTEHGRASRSTR